MFLAAFLVLVYTQKHSQQPPSPAEIRHEVSRQIASEASAPAAQAAPANPEGPAFATAQADPAGAAVTKLGNSFVEVGFPDFGGAIREVALKKYPAALGRPDPFIFNELHADPMLALARVPGLDRATRYELVSKSDGDIVSRPVLESRLEATRRYVLSPDKASSTDAYLIRCE